MAADARARALARRPVALAQPRFAEHLLHCSLEFFETDLAVAVFVSLQEDLLPELVRHLLSMVVGAEQLLEVLSAQLAVLVGVDDLEGLAHF